MGDKIYPQGLVKPGLFELSPPVVVSVGMSDEKNRKYTNNSSS